MFSDDFKKSEGGMFIKLEDGESVVGAFAGNVLEFYNNFKLRSQYSLDDPNIPAGSSKRFKVNFVSAADDGTLIPRILEGSKTTAKAIEKIVEKYGVDYFVEITRNGTGKTTTYSVLPERPLTEDEKKAVQAVKLTTLSVSSDDKEGE